MEFWALVLRYRVSVLSRRSRETGTPDYGGRNVRRVARSGIAQGTWTVFFFRVAQAGRGAACGAGPVFSFGFISETDGRDADGTDPELFLDIRGETLNVRDRWNSRIRT